MKVYAVYNAAEYQNGEEGGVKPNALYRWEDQADAFRKRMNTEFGCRFIIREEEWIKLEGGALER